jgi:hypothetical protein
MNNMRTEQGAKQSIRFVIPSYAILVCDLNSDALVMSRQENCNILEKTALGLMSPTLIKEPMLDLIKNLSLNLLPQMTPIAYPSSMAHPLLQSHAKHKGTLNPVMKRSSAVEQNDILGCSPEMIISTSVLQWLGSKAVVGRKSERSQSNSPRTLGICG